MVSAAAARKTVSVLFCDLADSTMLGERLDAEPLRELLGRWYEEMRIAVERHGGTVEKFIGDAVMAVFGLPRAHEDDALRAVRAALDMQRAVERLNASLEARQVPELRIRIGINTGEVVTGDDAATLATGDAVNTAKRLEESAALEGEADAGLVVERLRVVGGSGAAPPEELFWAVRRLFEVLARERPLLVLLEDVHWAEPTLLDLIEHVSRWSRDAPILLLCVARPELLEEQPWWEGTLVRLEPLSSGEATQLLEALDGRALLSPELRARVTEVAQGNPLYTEQLVAMLADE